MLLLFMLAGCAEPLSTSEIRHACQVNDNWMTDCEAAGHTDDWCQHRQDRAEDNCVANAINDDNMQTNRSTRMTNAVVTSRIIQRMLQK
jgi:hypothetical protein